MRWMEKALTPMGPIRVAAPASETPLLSFTARVGRHLLFSLLLPLRLPAWLRAHPTDVLLLPIGPGGILLPWRPRRTKLIGIVYHTYGQQALMVPGQWWKRLFVPFERATLRQMDRVFCFCPSTRRVLLQSYGIPEDRIDLLPQGIDLNFWKPETKRPGLVVCVARLEARKGVEVALEAWSAIKRGVPEATLVIVGDGIKRARIDAMIQTLSGVTRVASLPIGKLRSLVASAEVALCPAYLEGFGLACAEAMAAGTAVIGSDVDGLRDLIEEGRTGRLVPAGDAEALAAAVTEVLTFRERATQMGQAGSEAMKRFDAADADEMLRAAVKTVV